MNNFNQIYNSLIKDKKELYAEELAKRILNDNKSITLINEFIDKKEWMHIIWDAVGLVEWGGIGIIADLTHALYYLIEAIILDDVTIKDYKWPIIFSIVSAIMPWAGDQIKIIKYGSKMKALAADPEHAQEILDAINIIRKAEATPQWSLYTIKLKKIFERIISDERIKIILKDNKIVRHLFEFSGNLQKYLDEANNVLVEIEKIAKNTLKNEKSKLNQLSQAAKKTVTTAGKTAKIPAGFMVRDYTQAEIDRNADYSSKGNSVPFSVSTQTQPAQDNWKTFWADTNTVKKTN